MLPQLKVLFMITHIVLTRPQTFSALQNQEIDFAALPASMITDAVQSIISKYCTMYPCVPLVECIQWNCF